MRSFKELGIKPETKTMQGDKIKVSKLLNREIIVHSYRIEESKFKKENGERCLYMQVSVDGQMHVVFTGSKVLIGMISQVSVTDFPFTTTITREGEHYQFN